MKQGRISRIIGPVVDVRFANGDLPPVLGALRVESPQGPCLVEVHEHLNQTTIRGIVMSPTHGLRRGMPVLDTGAQISVPTGHPLRLPSKIPTSRFLSQASK